MTIERAIEYVEKVAAEQEYFMGQFDAASGYARSGNEAIRTESAKECEKCAAEHRQLAEWLRELQERRKADSCEGCKNIGLWENEYEYGISCPCLRCARRAKDNYEPERRVDD